MVNETIAVLINHIKGFFELLYLILVEHGKYIGSGPLGPFFGPGPPGRFSTRHGFKKPVRRAPHAPLPNLKSAVKFKINTFILDFYFGFFF
jgi:hypothetical protein